MFPFTEVPGAYINTHSATKFIIHKNQFLGLQRWKLKHSWIYLSCRFSYVQVCLFASPGGTAFTFSNLGTQIGKSDTGYNNKCWRAMTCVWWVAAGLLGMVLGSWCHCCINVESIRMVVLDQPTVLPGLVGCLWPEGDRELLSQWVTGKSLRHTRKARTVRM